MTTPPPKKQTDGSIDSNDNSLKIWEIYDNRTKSPVMMEEAERKQKEEEAKEQITAKKEMPSLLKKLLVIGVIGAIILIIGSFFPEYVALIVLGSLALIMVALYCRERLPW